MNMIVIIFSIIYSIYGYPNEITYSGNLIWEDEFNVLNESKWNHLITGSRGYNNKEFQYYRNNRKNSYVRNGILYIKPTPTADEYGESFLTTGVLDDPNCNLQPCRSVPDDNEILTPILSARIRTINSFSFKYGRLEVRAKMPCGDWIWPAIWMKPKKNVYGSWPVSGEIDLIEIRGNRKLRNWRGETQGADKMAATIHFGPDTKHDAWRLTTYNKYLTRERKTFCDDFHVYEIEWTKRSLKFYLDKEYLGGYEETPGGFWEFGHFEEMGLGPNPWINGTNFAPYDEEFFITLNAAVGGNFFPIGFRNFPYPRPWKDNSSSQMKEFWEAKSLWYPTWNGEDSALQVDYVRVYSVDE